MFKKIIVISLITMLVMGGLTLTPLALADNNEKMPVSELAQIYKGAITKLNKGPVSSELLAMVDNKIRYAMMTGDWARAAFWAKYMQLYFADMVHIVPDDMVQDAKMASYQYAQLCGESLRFSGNKDLVKIIAAIQKEYIDHPKRFLKQNRNKIKR